MRIFLKPTAGMGTWKKWARPQPQAFPPTVVAFLPVVQCPRAVQASEARVVSNPTGLCDPCYGQLKRSQRRESVSGTPISPITPTPLPSQQLGCEDQPAVPVLPIPAVFPGTPVLHAPVTGAARRDQAASTPLLVSSRVGSDIGRMVNRVIGGGYCTCLPSAPPARMAGATGAATELALLPGHGVAPPTVQVLQVAQQPCRVDPDRSLQLS